MGVSLSSQGRSDTFLYLLELLIENLHIFRDRAKGFVGEMRNSQQSLGDYGDPKLLECFYLLVIPLANIFLNLMIAELAQLHRGIRLQFVVLLLFLDLCPFLREDQHLLRIFLEIVDLQLGNVKGFGLS